MKTLLISLLICLNCQAQGTIKTYWGGPFKLPLQDTAPYIDYRKADSSGKLFANDTSAIDKKIYREHFLMSQIIRAMSPSGHINWKAGFVAAWEQWRRYLIEQAKK